ncbi:hypothetical protein LTR53_006985 [Teratosphaeriaceae sp. CCFEE 6253]|nr:hypothetical protein LTR53_006985 [Teratosphaeriaceae sp. CCFEE 6253]
MVLEAARGIISKIAGERSARYAQDSDRRPLDAVVGRTVSHDVDSPSSTPTFDSVAVDGYAVIASQVSHVTSQRPIQLRCMGSMKAGDPPLEVDDTVNYGMVSCVEVFIGAAFPTAWSTRKPFDAIVPREHATVVREDEYGRVLRIERSPLTSWHKRIAGSDFRKGSRILDKGTSIAPKFVMALASVGVREVAVTREARVGIISIGSELASTVVGEQSLRYKTPDANGPYLTAAIREMGEDAIYLGSLPDDSGVIASFVQDKVANDHFEVLVTTGRVSAGAPSAVDHALMDIGAETHFESVAMQPGGTVLFASMPEPDLMSVDQSPSSIHDSASSNPNVWTPPKPSAKQANIPPVIFALPSSPIAAACCFRFLVTPYIRALIGMQSEQAMMARVTANPSNAAYQYDQNATSSKGMIVEGSPQFDIFRHAILTSQHDRVMVEVSRERSPAKASPFASSNCWLHIARGSAGVSDGEVANIYPFCSPKS